MTTFNLLKLLLIASLFSLIGATIRLKENVSSINPAILNICQSAPSFTYYHAYESDNTKYIQCDPWGEFI